MLNSLFDSLNGDDLEVAGKDYTDKAVSFIKLIIEKNISLAMTPEYCFPWECLDAIKRAFFWAKRQPLVRGE